MTINQWSAVDATTVPAKLARELRDAWERFVIADGGPDIEFDEPVRGPIADSWRRSRDAGVDPHGHQLAPAVMEPKDTRKYWRDHLLSGATSVLDECLWETAIDTGNLVVVADADGTLLSVRGDVHVRSRAADSMNFAEGSLWSEEGAGTNAVGTAVATGHAVQVFAAEHFNEPVQRWTCAAAPVRDPEEGRVIGVVDLTGDFSSVHAHSLAVVIATAQAVESFLRLRMHEQDQRLRARHAGRLDAAAIRRALVSRSGRVLVGHPEHWSPGTRLELPPGGGELILPNGLPALAEPTPDSEAMIVSRLDKGPTSARPRPRLELELLGTDQPRAVLDGRPVDLRRRHAELLVLLQAHPRGADAEELSLALYGDRGNPASVRVEMSRLRKQLPGCLHPERYLLAADVDSDADHVRRALRVGACRLAAELYPGPLLPRSEAPGVVQARDELEGWLRNAVLTGDDAEALWHWTRSTSGADDLMAGSRLLGHLAYDDARRAEVAAHVTRLREALRAPV